MMSSWESLLKFCDPVSFSFWRAVPFLLFASSCTLFRKARKKFLQSQQNKDIVDGSDMRMSTSVISLMGSLYCPSILYSNELSWEKFKTLIPKVLMMSDQHTQNYVSCTANIRMNISSTTIVCSVQRSGKLTDFCFLEGNKDHSMCTQCAIAILCFRPTRRLPASFIDIAEGKEVIFAYIFPQCVSAAGRCTIGISVCENNGVMNSNFSFLIGSEEISETQPDEPKAIAELTSSHACNYNTNNSFVLHQDDYGSPETHRNMTDSQRIKTDICHSDSPGSSSSSVTEILDFNCAQYDPQRSDNVNDVEAGGRVGCLPQKKEGSLPTFRNLNASEKLEWKAMQSKAKANHEKIKHQLLALGYTKEEIAAIKSCLTELVRERHPDLNHFQRSEKIQAYIQKDIISSLDVEKRLAAIRASKIKTVHAT